ncbi:MAG: thiamine pyrophosphate-binding protein [Actinomycetota bacterium]
MSREPQPTVKYSELVMDWLGELGYTHCFFVAGGNIMHLLDGARSRMVCVPFVHEVAAGVAAEYFNEADGDGRAFALVTAGPGLTNIVTAVAGAFLESRELLVLGGQVKSTDLADGGIRQRGIQEVDGASIVAPITVESVRVERPVPRDQLVAHVERARRGRAGPVFVQMCLDAQGAPVDPRELGGVVAVEPAGAPAAAITEAERAVEPIADLMRSAQRPVWLVGGGVTRATAADLREQLGRTGVPVMTTWNGIDRVGADEPWYFGRPNTWGQRAANVLLQQADLLVAFGTRLGMQQTGFNWQQFVPVGKVVQVDLDPAELEKGHPRVDLAVAGDANTLLRRLVALDYPDYGEWVAFCNKVKARLPLREEANVTAPGFVCPYDFYLALSELTTADDVVVPCSSGGANSVAMQTFQQSRDQVVITDKGLASMGYGLAGAIGAALSHPDRRTVLVEGDGGFIQNLQELATVAVNDLNLKIFIFSNEGYASIRMTQRNYFDGQYLGCDTQTGLGFPRWSDLFQAYDIPLLELDADTMDSDAFRNAFAAPGPHGFIVAIDPEQTYFPKITSRITETGSMESNPLHIMAPDLPDDVAGEVFRYL